MEHWLTRNEVRHYCARLDGNTVQNCAFEVQTGHVERSLCSEPIWVHPFNMLRIQPGNPSGSGWVAPGSSARPPRLPLAGPPRSQ